MQKDKVAADLERAIQRLQDLRFEVGAQVVWLADRTGQVLAEAGMTLLEIMIVLAILGAIMGLLVGPRILKSWEEAKKKETALLIAQYAGGIIE